MLNNQVPQSAPQQNQQQVNMRAPEAFDFTKPEMWPVWEKRFLRFISVANLSWKTSKEKTDWLCYTMGQQAEEILLKILPNAETKSFDEVLEAFRDYFVPKKNIILERFKFNTRVQLPDESVDTFVSALYSLAEKCDYSTLKEEMIRDRIIVGIRDSKTSQHLKLKSDLTLASVMTEIRQAEARSQKARELMSTSTPNNNEYPNFKVIKELGSDEEHCGQCDLPRHLQGEVCIVSNSSGRKRRQNELGNEASGAKKVHNIVQEANTLNDSQDVEFCKVSISHTSGQSCSFTISASPVKNVDVNNVRLLGFEKFANRFTTVLASMNPGNLITSPLSAQVLLAMAAYGAAGQTATEMRASLQIPQDDTVGLSGYQSLLRLMNAEKQVVLHIASKIFIASYVTVKPAYQKLTTEKFLSPTQSVDFTDSQAAARIINIWSEKQTNKRIKNIFEPASFAPDTVLVLVNVVYFKGQWEIPFPAAWTKDEPFHIDATTTKPVSIMHNSESFRFGIIQKLDARFIEMPYKGGSLSMIIIVPLSLGRLNKVLNNLHRVNLKQTLQEVDRKDVKISVPKFKIESTLDLQPTLTKLGMTTIVRGDFSRITEAPLNVIEVVQTAFIEVNETGTEAVAKTRLRGGGGDRSLEFKVNQPFYFTIFHHQTGASLFTGIVKEPVYESVL